MKYLYHRIGYDSLPMFLLDVLAKFGIYIQPFYFIQEGLYEGMDREFADRFSDFSFRYLDKRDMKNIASQVERNVPLKQLLSHLEKGRRCFGCLVGDELVAFSWFNLDTCTYPGYNFRLAYDEAYLFDAYTFPQYRGRGIAPYVRYRLYKELEALGRTNLLSVSERYNKPAVQFKLKLKATIKDKGVRLVLFNRWQHTFLSRKQH
jgi:GNAT superfamily N-acetyltransferase